MCIIKLALVHDPYGDGPASLVVRRVTCTACEQVQACGVRFQVPKRDEAPGLLAGRLAASLRSKAQLT